jgi:hypothetical protein
MSKAEMAWASRGVLTHIHDSQKAESSMPMVRRACRSRSSRSRTTPPICKCPQTVLYRARGTKQERKEPMSPVSHTRTRQQPHHKAPCDLQGYEEAQTG